MINTLLRKLNEIPAACQRIPAVLIQTPARIVAKYMDKYCDKAVTVVNMPGSGGRIGAIPS